MHYGDKAYVARVFYIYLQFTCFGNHEKMQMHWWIVIGLILENATFSISAKFNSNFKDNNWHIEDYIKINS